MQNQSEASFDATSFDAKQIFGDYDAEVTPVPIPNTVVKLCSADDTWWEAARESRSSPEQKRTLTFVGVLFLLGFIRVEE